jgi:hypothetical protein
VTGLFGQITRISMMMVAFIQALAWMIYAYDKDFGQA